MELFNLHIQQGRDLCSKLATTASTIKTPPAQLTSQLAIEVVSPILANSQQSVSVRCAPRMHAPARPRAPRACNAARSRARCAFDRLPATHRKRLRRASSA